MALQVYTKTVKGLLISQTPANLAGAFSGIIGLSWLSLLSSWGYGSYRRGRSNICLCLTCAKARPKLSTKSLPKANCSLLTACGDEESHRRRARHKDSHGYVFSHISKVL